MTIHAVLIFTCPFVVIELPFCLPVLVYIPAINLILRFSYRACPDLPAVDIILLNFCRPHRGKFTIAIVYSSAIKIVECSEGMRGSFATKVDRVPALVAEVFTAISTFKLSIIEITVRTH